MQLNFIQPTLETILQRNYLFFNAIHNITDNRYVMNCNEKQMTTMSLVIESVTSDQILDNAIYVSLRFNALRKSMNPLILSSTVSVKVERVLVGWLWTKLGKSYPSAKMQFVYSAAPVDWAKEHLVFFFCFNGISAFMSCLMPEPSL